MLKVLVIMQVIFESNWTFSCLVLQNINVALICKTTTHHESSHHRQDTSVTNGQKSQIYGQATTRSSTFLLPLLSSQTCGTLGSVLCSLSTRSSMGHLSMRGDLGPRLATGMAVDVEGLLVSPAQNAETDPFVLSGAEYTSVCRDCGKYRQVWLIWDHPL